MTISIFIIDDEGIMRDGLCALLAVESEIEVLGTAMNGGEALERAPRSTPQVIIMDFSLNLASGPDDLMVDQASLARIAVLRVTMHREDRYIDAALRSGADGYLLKSDSRGQLLTAIRNIASGTVHQSLCPRSCRERLCTPAPQCATAGRGELRAL